MKRIIVLIKKDLYYNQTMYIFVYIVSILLMLIAIFELDSGKAASTLNYLVYTSIASMVIAPYSFNKDDDLSTRKLISALPVTLDEILTAKCLLCFIASSIIACTALVIFNGLGEVVLYRYALIPIAISMFFTSIFILVYYNWDLHLASFTCMMPIILFAIIANNLEENWNVEENVINLRYFIIIAVATILFTAVMKKITVKFVNK
ncbi:MAG: ABC-2 transporter permease [Clostridia bacterium]